MDYENFIQNIIDTRGQWDIPEGEYWEGHHIIPRCKGGEGNTKSRHPNVIWLFPEEHYNAHKLLALENPNDFALLWAWDAMAYNKKDGRDYFVSEEDYGILRRMHSEIMKGKRLSVNPETGYSYLKGTHLSEETKNKISKANKGRPNPKSEKTKIKMSNSHKGKKKNYPNGIKDKIAINNGVEILWINKDQSIPEGYQKGLILDVNRDTSNYNKSWTVERRKAFGVSRSGENNPHYGVHINYGTSMTGKKHSEESKQKHRDTCKNKSKEEKALESQRKSEALLGRSKPDYFKDICSKNTSSYIYYINGKEIYGKNNLINYIGEKYQYPISVYDIDCYFKGNITNKMQKMPNIDIKRVKNENCKNPTFNS